MGILKLKYVYTFYNFGEVLAEEIIEQSVEIGGGCRFTLEFQEDGSFVLSDVKEDHLGKFVILTFPNKDNVLVYAGQSTELSYDEYNNAMGDDNHNVYEGTMTLEV